MDNFEEALNKAKEVATVAFKKTEEVINIQKQKIDIATLNNKLNNAYAELGRAIYLKEGWDLSSEQETVDKIDSLNAQIKAIKEEIRKTKCKDVCESCGKEIEKDAAFCSQCGAKQEG